MGRLELSMAKVNSKGEKRSREDQEIIDQEIQVF